jgi:hypothetical protein
MINIRRLGFATIITAAEPIPSGGEERNSEACNHTPKKAPTRAPNDWDRSGQDRGVDLLAVEIIFLSLRGSCRQSA